MAMEFKITFKKEEKWLYDKITDEHTSRGSFVKDVLIEHYKNEIKQTPQIVPQRSFKGIL